MADVRFAKINVRVRDLGPALEYVRQVLGGEIVVAPHGEPFGEVAIARVGGLIIEIIRPTPGTPMDQTIDRRGEGIDSIGFVAADVAAAAAEMEARGARLVRPAEAGLASTVWVHPKNPVSISIELFSPAVGGIFEAQTGGTG